MQYKCLLAGGKLEIIDYKTNKEDLSEYYINNNLQLMLYQYAISKLWHLPVGNLALYHLRTNEKYDASITGIRIKKELESAKKLVLETAESIKSNKFYAKKNVSCPCDFAFSCPYYQKT